MKTILHTVNQSPFSSLLLQQCFDKIHNQDGLLLLEDGVYAALSGHACAARLQTHKHCYAIKSDLEARGLTVATLADNITLIDYHDFVRLTTEYDLVHSWY